MATLTLEPDEVLPTTPAPLEGEALGPFPIFWRGKERQFGFRAVELLPKKHFLFAREFENQAAGNWLVYQRDSMIPAKWSPDSPRKVFENLSNEFTARRWMLGRFFARMDSSKNRLVGALMAETGSGAWLDKELLISNFFDFKFPLEVFLSDRLQVQRFWKQQNADLNSTIRFAARWKPCHNKDRAAVLLGDVYAETMEVMRWILLCETYLWARDNSWLCRLKPFTRFDRDFSFLLCKRGPLPLYLFVHIAEKMPQTHQLLLFLGKQYIKNIADLLGQIHRCVREGWELEIIELQLEVEGPPSDKEQLEAALNLRDWLRKNNAPAELLALLAP